MQNEKTALFETMPVGKALFTMAIPTIASQLITMAAVQEGGTPLPAQTRIVVTHATTYQLTVRPLGVDSASSHPQ